MGVRRTKGYTRRDFLRGAAGAAIAGAAGLTAHAQEAQASTLGKAKVVLIRDAAVIDDNGKVNADVIARMLDQAVAELMGESGPEAAWKRLVQPGDTVGIKTNVWNFLRTPPELEEAIQRRAIGAGVPAEQVSLDDRGVRNNPVFKNATALINARPMRTHHWSGVGSLIKNYIMFSEKPSSWHADSCADLAGVWDLPEVKGKTRLNVLVMLTPLFHSKGPHAFHPEYTWPYKGLIVSADPVAADATGLRILEAKRLEHFGGEQPFAVSPHHIRVAQDKFRLGVADPERIELVRLGWDDSVFV